MLAGAPWGAQAKLIGQDLVASQFPTLTGAGQTVVVIDSGVDYNHPVLGGGWGKKVIAGWDFSGNDGNPMSDSYAHGTGVAGMIGADGYDYKGYHYQGIAPGAKLIALRQNNSYGVDAALKWVIANKAKYNITAVNFTDYGGKGTIDTGKSINASLKKLDDMNVYVSAPSGNAGTKYPVAVHPGDWAVVGSVSKSDGISGFSQRGPGLDFLAPGEKVTVPYYDTGSKKHIYVDVADGTSWSAPQIAGAAAVIRQINPGFSNAQVTSILKDSAVQRYDGATKRNYARLNLYAAVRLAMQRSGQAVPPVTSNPTPTPTPAPNPGQPAGNAFNNPTVIGANTTLQAEDFDAGNEGQAYHDTTGGNQGGNNYRNTGVDLISANDSGSTRAVGLIKAGEWLKYTVNVQQGGTYNLEFRLAAIKSGGQFHLEIDGKNVTGTLGVPDTRSWTSYTTVVKGGVGLSAGKHTLRLVFDRNGASGFVANLNHLKFVKVGGTPVSTPAATPTGSPFKNFNVAARTTTTIQAEDFDNGSAGVAYRDLTSSNEGKQYRNTGADIEKSLDYGGGHHLGYLKQGEWYNYTVNVTRAGTFNLDTRVASLYNNSAFHIEVDGKNVTGTLKFVNTGSFQKWTTVRKSGINLTAGRHTLKLVIESNGGHKFAGNVNWMKLS